MTIGIYALYWEEPDLVYVGLSSNIEKRYLTHKQKMCNNTHSNYRVQQTYNTYGLPALIVLEACLIQELENKERLWTQELNSLNPKIGLNIVSAGSSGGSGVLASRSEYSKLQILLVLRYLSSNAYKQAKEIEELTDVGKDTITAIAKGTVHTWLREEYPFRYSLMCSRRSKRIETVNITNKLVWDIELISPVGSLVKCTNITRFAIDNDLDQGHLSKVINGKRISHKGWKLKKD